ncbi:MAG: phospholipase A [Betaproteobacteria bacterium]|nr:phospholipase A [Betaproteobacteria bacterium]
MQIGKWVVISVALVFAWTTASGDMAARAADGVADLFKRIDEPEHLKKERLGSEIYEHEKIYFIAGGDSADFDAKFQLSLKVRLFSDFFVSYSQTNVWDLGKPSAPFHDTSHRPAFFYYKPDLVTPSFGTVGLAAGIEHESNGKGGVDSRSMWIGFVQPQLRVGPDDDYHWRIAPKLYGYITKEENNSDIAKYRGYGDFAVVYRHDRAWEFGVTARVGKDFDKGSAQLDISYPIERIFSGVPGYFYGQMFTGYGETLLDYNVRRNDQIRFGYMLVRDR